MTKPTITLFPCIVAESPLKEINRSIAEKDAGEFATDEEVEAAFEYVRTGDDPRSIPKEKS